MEYNFIQEFIGEINTVQIQDKQVYYSTIFILEQLENKFDLIKINTNFIEILSTTIDRMYYKIDSFNFSDLEQDFYFAIQQADNLENLSFDYAGSYHYLEDLNDAIKTLDSQFEQEESLSIY